MRLMCHRRSAVLQRCRYSARGQAQVEFALVIVLLIITLVSILELILLMHTYNTVADAAKEGLRYAIVHGSNNPQGIACTASGCTAPDITNGPAPPGTVPGYCTSGVTCYGVVQTYAQYSLHNMAGMTVTVNYLDNALPAKANPPPNRVQVIVAYPLHPVFGFGWPTVTVYSAAEGRIMN